LPSIGSGPQSSLYRQKAPCFTVGDSLITSFHHHSRLARSSGSLDSISFMVFSAALRA
jgi:hypothetical protein